MFLNKVKILLTTDELFSSIFPTEQDPNGVHLNIANNTGSLPDLTNLQFQSPLATPIDLEDQTGVSYSTNNCLRVPSMHTRFLHTCKGVTADTGKLPADSYITSHSQQQSSQYHIYSQPQTLNVSSTTDVNTVSWRTLLETYRSSSPAENSSYSAPQSPVSQTFSPVSSPGLGPPSKDPFPESSGYYLQSNAQTNALQEHFRQFNMADNPPVSAVDNIFLSDINNLQYSQVHSGRLIDGRDILDGTTGYYPTLVQDHYSRLSHSGVLSSSCGGQNHSTAPQTPQTPNSIPNIILTDFSSVPINDDQLCRHDFVKDIGSVMVGMSDSFDSDLFVTDDLKAGLDPIGIDELHMLTDSDIVTDPATEDSFRLDRL
ncbi:hypothetical protein CHUAL_007172 [Chamberlinius hualienensis]